MTRALPKRATDKRPAVFVDRDGTINVNVGYIGDYHKIELIDRAADAIAEFNRMGYLVIMITNQSAIARGLATENEVKRVCSEVARQVAVISGGHFDGVYYCPYHPDFSEGWEDYEHWRKPAGGMLREAIREFQVDSTHSWMIGDGEIDHLAARDADPDIRTILLPSRYHDGDVGADYYSDTLWEAANFIRTQLPGGHLQLDSGVDA